MVAPNLEAIQITFDQQKDTIKRATYLSKNQYKVMTAKNAFPLLAHYHHVKLP